MPKISAIIPVWNVEKYLARCLDSVLAQTFSDFEVICVNDGSPDNCGKILAKYAQKDKRIKVITQDNQGLSQARNTGFKKAKGDYIYFLDSDDTIHPQLFEICYHLAESHKADMVSFNLKKINIDYQRENFYDLFKIKYKITDHPLFFQKKRSKWKIFVNVWTKFYKRNLIKDLFFIPNITMEDYPYTYAVLAKHPKTILLDIPLYYYKENNASISNTEFTVKKIKSYQTGLNFVWKIYQNSPAKERKFVLREIFPNMLKQQLNKILRAPKEEQTSLYDTFAQELAELNKKGCLTWHGHKLSRYLTYKHLIKITEKKEKLTQ